MSNSDPAAERQLSSMLLAIQRNFHIGTPFAQEIIEVRRARSARAYENERRLFEIVFRCSSQRKYPLLSTDESDWRRGGVAVGAGECCNCRTCFFPLLACDFSVTPLLFPP